MHISVQEETCIGETLGGHGTVVHRYHDVAIISSHCPSTPSPAFLLPSSMESSRSDAHATYGSPFNYPEGPRPLSTPLFDPGGVSVLYHNDYSCYLDAGGRCNDRQYTCSNGQCISAGNVCDSQCDCVDCNDETDCANYYTIRSGVPECHKGVALTCIVAPLNRKKDRCIAAHNICDGFKDCHNGEQVSDEYGCLNESAECALLEEQEGTHFQCSDGRCLPVDLRCDGKRDCLHGEDEDEDVCREGACGDGEWRCGGGGQCIAEARRCDLVLDCRDKTDEMNCVLASAGPYEVSLGQQDVRVSLGSASKNKSA
ncbi:G-protein coupled receptor GRL101-like [Penaeus japonicus]|uniref:G-protein coupled receptor GRL101-like n=1 Tax=Penaeus japonicus TaxID=27405 RepID=UPI001C715B07|nr:G-protein coupled receptor GRL101-like [Penaeus japonicus]